MSDGGEGEIDPVAEALEAARRIIEAPVSPPRGRSVADVVEDLQRERDFELALALELGLRRIPR